jgi:tetratricopeptide (TPR) repeat protein
MDDRRNTVRDLVLGNLSPEESLRVLDMVEKDPELSHELELAASLVNIAAEDGKELFGKPVTLSHDAAPLYRAVNRRLSSHAVHAWMYVRYTLAAVVLIGVLLPVVSHFMTDPYVALSTLSDSVDMERLRTTGEQELARLYEEPISGNDEETIRFLERYLRRHPHNKVTGYVRLSLGEQYLRSARTSILTLFPRFDAPKVNRALHQFDQIIESGGNDRLVEEAYWLRAKAALMVGRPHSAISDLQELLRLKGRLSHQAEELIGKITNTMTSE